MPRYRTDRIEENEHGQKVGYADWMGGPTISKVEADCPDGQRRWAHITGEADTFFSLPGYVNNGRQRVSGWIGCEDGKWQFHPYQQHPQISWIYTRRRSS